MRHMPLGPQYYPIESMGLTDAEFRDMQIKQSATSTLDNSDYFTCIGRNGGDSTSVDT